MKKHTLALMAVAALGLMATAASAQTISRAPGHNHYQHYLNSQYSARAPESAYAPAGTVYAPVQAPAVEAPAHSEPFYFTTAMGNHFGGV